ncbi:ParB/RepB/Spo0J family partition protein [Desulfuromonas thiophila]|uniref:ParB/RepB/Spo0J family partition protein n=1 Tax=Desulfuromonas thiophila TaxID=57664 RepID=A0A1G7B3I0_9BACT|nr:ParB N-terminal domain-containing protein [Desulfuromonas thiophila]SDE21583.1 ParB/RepB/Spo0J family partition protein [Desulfuromonas thiophila]
MKRIEMEIELRDPATLEPHPLNAEIYGDGADAELVQSVKEQGVMEPLLVTMDGVIISGHRRCHAAKLAGQQVPVLVVDFGTLRDEEEAVIHNNRQREKTTEVRAREFARLKQIEAGRAKGRQVESALRNQPQSLNGANLPYSEPEGRARDIAAEKVGLKPRTAEKAAQVVEVIDTLKERGEVEQADELRAKLNKTVNGAFKETKGVKAVEAAARQGRKASPKEKHFRLISPVRYQSLHRDLFNFLAAQDRDGWPDMPKYAAVESIEEILTFLNR